MKKQLILVLLLGILPLILLSNTLDYQALCKAFHIKNVQSLSRTGIIQEVLSESLTEGVWANDTKNVYIYNTPQSTKVDTIKSFMYNSETMEWTQMMTVAYTYDNSGEYVTQLEYSMSFMNMTFPLFRMNAQYDNLHRTTMWTTSSYDMENLEWGISFWSKMFYNTNSINYIISYNAASEDEPESWEKSIFNNDGQGRPTTTTDYISADSLLWTENQRTQFTYHAADTSTGADFISAIAHLYIILEGSPDVLHWGNTMISETLDQVYNEDWENDTKTTYTYNAQNKLAEEIMSNWDGAWINESRSVLTYDSNNNIYRNTQAIWSDPDWIDNYRYTYTWDQGTSADDNVAPALGAIRINTTPNPFSDNLSINISSKVTKPVSVAIYNARGQLVKNISAKSNTSITWNGNDESNNPVAKGIYFIKAQTQGTTTTGKILKLK